MNLPNVYAKELYLLYSTSYFYFRNLCGATGLIALETGLLKGRKKYYFKSTDIPLGAFFKPRLQPQLIRLVWLHFDSGHRTQSHTLLCVLANHLEISDLIICFQSLLKNKMIKITANGD